MILLLEGRRAEGKPFTGPRDSIVKRTLKKFGARDEMVDYMAINDTPRASLYVKIAKYQIVVACGLEPTQFFRRDYEGRHRGRPFVVVDGYRENQVVVPTHHPYHASFKKQSLDEMFDDLKQALYRHKPANLFEQWPEDCHTCGNGVDHYDAGGVAWCKYHFKGYEVPRQLDQLVLAL